MNEVKRNIRFWLLTTEYPPFHGGGISTYCFHTAKMLSRNGYSVTVFVPDSSIADFEIYVTESVELIRFNPTMSLDPVSLDHASKLSYRLAKLVKQMVNLKGKPDIIEIQDYLGIGYYLLQFKFILDPELAGIPVVLTLHSPAFLYQEYNKVATYRFPEFWTCEMEKQSIATADLIISPTVYIKNEVLSRLPSKQFATAVVANPFENQLKEQTPSPIIDGKIVCYGKLSEQKGSFALLNYFSELWDEGFNFSLTIIGDDTIVNHIENKMMGDIVRQRYAKYINRNLLQLQGKIKPDESPGYIKDAQLIIFPSIIDNLPYAVLEMMSQAKVVLSSVNGGQQEIITNGEDGFLFDHSVPGDFRNQLLHILSLNEKELISIGSKAKEKIKQKYSYEVIFPEKDKLLRKLTEKEKLTGDRFPFLYQEPFTKLDTVNGNEKLSVVIPSYNMGKMVLQAVDSVRNCTYPHLEIIIVDDGTDDAESIKALLTLRRLAHVKVFNKKNEGLASARNFGALKAKGAYLAFLDADDMVSPKYYERAIAVLKMYENVFFVGSWVQYFGNSQKIWPAFTPQPPFLFVHNPVNSSGLVYKTEAFLQSGLNDVKLEFGLEDYESVVSMMAKGYNGVVIPEVHFHYRVRNGSMYRKMNRNKILFSYTYITDKNAAYFSKFSIPVIHLLNANGPGFLYDNPTEGRIVYSKSQNNSRLYNFAASYIKQSPFLKRIAINILRFLNK